MLLYCCLYTVSSVWMTSRISMSHGPSSCTANQSQTWSYARSARQVVELTVLIKDPLCIGLGGKIVVAATDVVPVSLSLSQFNRFLMLSSSPYPCSPLLLPLCAPQCCDKDGNTLVGVIRVRVVEMCRGQSIAFVLSLLPLPPSRHSSSPSSSRHDARIQEPKMEVIDVDDDDDIMEVVDDERGSILLLLPTYDVPPDPLLSICEPSYIILSSSSPSSSSTSPPTIDPLLLEGLQLVNDFPPSPTSSPCSPFGLFETVALPFELDFTLLDQ